MAKKADLLQRAEELGLEASSKNTIAELDSMIAQAESKKEGSTEAASVNKEEPKVAKAGKRSAKSIKEAEELAAKEAKKANSADSEEVSSTTRQKPTRSRLERSSKRFQEASKVVDKEKLYSLSEALDLAIQTSTVKFDSTVEMHINLNVDPRQADQNIRDNLVLPSGSGKTVKVAVFADDDLAKEAKTAGADIAGNDDLLKQIEKGIIDFDILIATPNLMAKLGKHARVLGPKGLMPNPKSGTVTNDVVKAVEQSKAGRVEYRVDSNGIVHIGIGKSSFGNEKLSANAKAIFSSIRSNKPASIKGSYVKGITISSSMGPGIKISLSEI